VVYFTKLSVSGIIQRRLIGKDSEGNVRSVVAVICDNLPGGDGRNKEGC
jgi:hypothetical protein